MIAYSEAEDCARRAVELDPQDADALHTLSEVLAQRGNCEEALDVLQCALRIDGDRENGARFGVATLLIKLVAAGHRTRVKQLIEDAGLIQRLEAAVACGQRGYGGGDRTFAYGDHGHRYRRQAEVCGGTALSIGITRIDACNVKWLYPRLAHRALGVPHNFLR